MCFLRLPCLAGTVRQHNLRPVSRPVDGYSLVGQGGYEFLSDEYVGRELSDRRLSCVVAVV